MTGRPALRAIEGGMQDATPPHNSQAEQSLLGILLVDNEIFFKVSESVAADDFYDPVHARIYDAIEKTINAGRMADAQTLRGQFDAEEALKPLGGGRYLVDLCAAVITTINAADYAQHIHELATRRRLIAFGNEVKGIAADQTAPPSTGENLLNKVETILFNLAEKRGKEGAVDLATAWEETLNQINDAMKGKAQGIKTGLAGLDEKIGGLQPGTLYTIAARPAMGKTALGLTIAVNAAQGGAKVLFDTLEVSRNEVIERIIARMYGPAGEGFSHHNAMPPKLQRSQISMDQFNRIYNLGGEILSWPLFIDDTPALTIAQIRGRAIRQKRRHGLHLLIIDYLGLIKANDRQINRNYQIEEITQGLKNLAKELKVPVLLLAQLNRELEKRDDKRPILADLRDSGSVEQDSDVVMFIYRHEHYITRAEPRRNDREKDEAFEQRMARWRKEVEDSRHKAELIIAKLRQGETGTVPLAYEGWRFHFFDATDSRAASP